MSGPSHDLPRFHLAFPVDDLDEARRFYGKTLSCAEGRSTDHWIDWDFYGHPITSHLSDNVVRQAACESEVDGHKVPIPHFGALLSVEEFHETAQRLRDAGTEFVLEPYLRYAGKPGEQWTMFLQDPSGNSLEFKAFTNENDVFAT